MFKIKSRTYTNNHLPHVDFITIKEVWFSTCKSTHRIIIEMVEHRDRNCMTISTDSEKALTKPTFFHDQNFGEAK